MQLCPLLLLLLLGGFGVAKEEREPLPSALLSPLLSPSLCSLLLSSLPTLCCSPLSLLLLSAALLSPYSLLLSSLCSLLLSSLSAVWLSLGRLACCMSRTAAVTETTAHGTGYGLWIMEVPWYYSIWYI